MIFKTTKPVSTAFVKAASLLLVLTLVSALALPAPVAAAPPGTGSRAVAQDREYTMVVLGDSIAAGYSAPTGQGYADLVASDQHMRLLNYAVGGWRTEHIIDQLLNDSTVREAVKSADIIQIAIGGNDLQQTGYVGPAVDAMALGDYSLWMQHSHTIAARFAQIVDLVRELNPVAPFFVFNSYTPDYKRFGSLDISNTIGTTQSITGIWLYETAQNFAIPYFNSTYVSYLARHPGAFTLVDIFDAFPENDSYYYGTGMDVIHPSAAGHLRLAERLGAAIDAYNTGYMKVIPYASVEKYSGNKNLLTVTVTEAFPAKAANTFTVSLPIDNNATGYYQVGAYKVYVDTKGNTQIRDIYITGHAG